MLISHRLGTVRDADRIVVLDAGTLVEQGTHTDLLAARGIYATLFAMQSAGYVGVDRTGVPDRPLEVSP